MQEQTYRAPNWNQMMADWSALAYPTRCPECGAMHAQAPAGADWLGQWSEMPAVREWNRMWGGMLDPWLQGMRPAAGQQGERHGRRRHEQHGRDQHGHEQHGREGRRHEQHQHTKHMRDDCCSSCCQPDDCRCRCCVVNADLLVYVRLGETRVVPVTIENNIRREREVDVELSDWTTHGSPAVKVVGQVEPDEKFTLRPCEERTVTILVRVMPDADRPNVRSTDTAADAAAAPPAATAAHPQAAAGGRSDLKADLGRVRLPDVDTCTVFYADMRVKGCDIRPVRIAVAVLPRDCDAYRIDCQCGCCCH